MLRTAQIATLLAAAACGQLPSASDSSRDDALSVVANLAPQSFTHGTVAQAGQQLAYAFNGSAGDVIAPDVWPTAAGSGLHPMLTLLGPKLASTGHRTVVARGASRGGDADHQAIDGFKLPATGSYLAVVGSSGGTGEFTLRLWVQSSHAPRQENMQVNLQLRPSAATQQAVLAHGGGSSSSWTDAEIDAIAASMLSGTDSVVAFSDAQLLLSALVSASASGSATAAQLDRARQAALRLVGTPAHFSRLPANARALALWWLGSLQPLVFTPAEVAAPAPVASQIDALVSGWSGATQDAGSLHVRALSLGGVTYGYLADWSATQSDRDGSPVWSWWARDWFDGSAAWFGEQTQGATEPDDDARPQ